MKTGVRIINCARGGIVDEKDLADAIREGKVAGAALDVYVDEPPPPDHPLLKMDQVITTPHLGASTDEAQLNVAIAVAEQMVDFLAQGVVRYALNVPSVSPELLDVLRPYLLLAEKLGSLVSQMAGSLPKEVGRRIRRRRHAIQSGPSDPSGPEGHSHADHGVRG